MRVVAVRAQRLPVGTGCLLTLWSRLMEEKKCYGLYGVRDTSLSLGIKIVYLGDHSLMTPDPDHTQQIHSRGMLTASKQPKIEVGLSFSRTYSLS